jgi:hypothetical protein
VSLLFLIDSLLRSLTVLAMLLLFTFMLGLLLLLLR